MAMIFDDVGQWFGRAARTAAGAVGSAAVDVGQWVVGAAESAGQWVQGALEDAWMWAEENPEWAGALAGLALCGGGVGCAYVGHGVGQKIGEGAPANEVAAEGIRRSGDVLMLAGLLTGQPGIAQAGKAGRSLSGAVERGQADPQDVEVWSETVTTLSSDPAVREGTAQIGSQLGIDASSAEGVEQVGAVVDELFRLAGVEDDAPERPPNRAPTPGVVDVAPSARGGGFSFGGAAESRVAGGGFRF
jgi:hypothetical protein